MERKCKKDCLHCKHLHFKFADTPHVIYMAYTCKAVNDQPLYDNLTEMAEDISKDLNK